MKLFSTRKKANQWIRLDTDKSASKIKKTKRTQQHDTITRSYLCVYVAIIAVSFRFDQPISKYLNVVCWIPRCFLLINCSHLLD